MKNIVGKDYVRFLNEIKSRIASARIQASRLLNKELLKLYWDIGSIIVARQEQYGWGQGVVEKLAVDLTAESKGAKGFSAQNLWRMRLFYLAYKSSPKLAQLVREIPWGQNIAIMQMLKDAKEREYYIRAKKKEKWLRESTICREDIFINRCAKHSAYRI